MIITEHDAATGKTIERKATDTEVADLELQVALAAQDKADQETLAAERANAKAALLERLGITADEAELLLS